MEINHLKHKTPQIICDKEDRFSIAPIKKVLNESATAYSRYACKGYNMFWFTGGDGEFEVDLTNHSFPKNALFFLTPGQVGAYVKGKTPDGLVIYFSERYFSEDNSMEIVFLKHNLFNNQLPYILINERDCTLLKVLLQIMHDEMEHADEFAHEDSLSHLLRLFLITIQRRGTIDSEKRLCINNQADQLFVRFRQQVELHYREKHFIQDYADILNVSSKTLSRNVLEASGYTPLKFINYRLIQEARWLLLYSDMKIKEISYSLGFSDPSNFVKFFIRQTGKKPSFYRELEL